MFGLRECGRFGAPPKRLLGGVVGFYEALGGLLARYFVRAGGLGRPFLFKWGAAAQKIVGCVLYIFYLTVRVPRCTSTTIHLNYKPGNSIYGFTHL
jgi:hypothetical protein